MPSSVASGGSIGLIEDGDLIAIDIPNRGIQLQVSDAELAPRRENAPAAVAGQENRKPRTPRPPREEKREPRQVPVTDISKLQIGQEIKVRAGQSAMDATVLEIAKDGVRVQLSSGLAMIVRAEHLQF